jgi:hypothetical protein
VIQLKENMVAVAGVRRGSVGVSSSLWKNESECPQRVEEGGIPTLSLLLSDVSRKVVMRGETDLYKRLESRWWPAVEMYDSGVVAALADPLGPSISFVTKVSKPKT